MLTRVALACAGVEAGGDPADGAAVDRAALLPVEDGPVTLTDAVDAVVAGTDDGAAGAGAVAAGVLLQPASTSSASAAAGIHWRREDRRGRPLMGTHGIRRSMWRRCGVVRTAARRTRAGSLGIAGSS